MCVRYGVSSASTQQEVLSPGSTCGHCDTIRLSSCNLCAGHIWPFHICSLLHPLCHMSQWNPLRHRQPGCGFGDCKRVSNTARLHPRHGIFGMGSDQPHRQRTDHWRASHAALWSRLLPIRQHGVQSYFLLTCLHRVKKEFIGSLLLASRGQPVQRQVSVKVRSSER